MKNVVVYIGTIKKVVNFEEYQKYGEVYPTLRLERICVSVNRQAILIKDKKDNFYQFNMNGKLFNKLHLIQRYPSYVSSQYYDKNTLVPYYSEQPKRLSLRKLKRDLINDPRISIGIDY